MTDPIADMLTRIRNANSAQFDSVKMPGSKLKMSLTQILEREGYIAGFSVTENAPKPRNSTRSPTDRALDISSKTVATIRSTSR